MSTHRVVQASNFVPVNAMLNEAILDKKSNIPEPSRKRRRTIFTDLVEDGPEFRVYCHCLKCDLRLKPTLKLLHICKEHIALHSVGVKWKVRFDLFPNPPCYYIVCHPLFRVY